MPRTPARPISQRPKRQLVVSFWHIGLENLPEGRFRHRSSRLEFDIASDSVTFHLFEAL